MVERVPVKDEVVGSNPTAGAKSKRSGIKPLFLISVFRDRIRTEGRNHEVMRFRLKGEANPTAGARVSRPQYIVLGFYLSLSAVTLD